MAFTRNWLKSLSLTDEQVSAIIEEHAQVVDALKQQRETAKEEAEGYKKDIEKLQGVQKELDALKGGEDFKAKYESEKQAFEDFKKEIVAKEEAEKVKSAFRKLLTDERVKEDRLDMVMRHTDFSGMKLDKDGNLEGLDALKKTIDDDWGVFKVTTKERKQSVATPPEGGTGSGASRARELYMSHLKQQGVKVDTGKE